MQSEVFPPVELEVLLPIHNEAASIADTLAEIYQAIAPLTTMRFIISEDGSSDGTPQVLEQLATLYPMKLLSEPVYKGYSRAVLDGLQLADAPYILCLDADGQYDPADFARFWQQRYQADLLIGWRVNRQDTPLRKFLSGLFKTYYQLLFSVTIHDPSCPFVLMPGQLAKQMLPRLGTLRQGFWWEFIAWAWEHGYSMIELPVTHRLRVAGQTQVYRWHKLPGICWTHVTGLARIWRSSRYLQTTLNGGRLR